MSLNRVHRQRIALAVEAAKAGSRVSFTLASGQISGCQLLCQNGGRRDVVAAGGKTAMEALLPAAQKEFERQLVEACLEPVGA